MSPFKYNLAACLLLVPLSGFVHAAPYLPRSDDQVLERLPFRANDPLARELADLRAELRRTPENLDLALRLAQRYYSLVGEEGDPRYLGYAQAALAPWWEQPLPPIEVQVLRAGIRQFRHDFAGAISDLDQVLRRDPSHQQARVLRAVIHIVQARYQEAMADCVALPRRETALIAEGCEAMVAGLTGKAEPAYRRLKAALEREPKAEPEQRLWVLIRLAELAERLGKNRVAEDHYREALALGIPDTFLLAAYADFLLAQGRAAEVAKLLRDKQRSDALLLRLALAENMLGSPGARRHVETLAARFAAAELRGESVHQQEEARLALHLQKDPKKALALAADNWKVQREPRDARIFLEAALAADARAAAEPVLQWLQESGIEDATLIRLGEQLRGARK